MNYSVHHFKLLKDYLFLLLSFAANAPNNDGGIKDDKNYFLQREKIKSYNVFIDGRNFYDQPINDLIKQCNEVRRVSTGQGDDYTTACLLDYAYFKDNCRLITVDLSKQKALDARAIKQIVFQGVIGGAGNTKIRLYTILEKSKETVLEFYEVTAKVLLEYANGWMQ